MGNSVKWTTRGPSSHKLQVLLKQITLKLMISIRARSSSLHNRRTTEKVAPLFWVLITNQLSQLSQRMKTNPTSHYTTSSGNEGSFYLLWEMKDLYTTPSGNEALNQTALCNLPESRVDGGDLEQRNATVGDEFNSC